MATKFEEAEKGERNTVAVVGSIDSETLGQELEKPICNWSLFIDLPFSRISFTLFLQQTSFETFFFSFL